MEPSASGIPVGKATVIRGRHVAELIADDLREYILDGGLQSGDFLPKQEDLVERYGSSRPSVREALRILETEGLISVRRGRFGGAVVHRPDAHTAAHTLGMILRAQRVPTDDLSDALGAIEPVCAAMCAARPDRATEVVPRLAELNADARACLDDAKEFTEVSRRFHEALVALCGNDTLILVLGALETVWSAHANTWITSGIGPEVPRAERERGLAEHEALVELIRAGETREASDLAHRHLEWVPVYAVDELHQVDPSLVTGDPRQR